MGSHMISDENAIQQNLGPHYMVKHILLEHKLPDDFNKTSSIPMTLVRLLKRSECINSHNHDFSESDTVLFYMQY
jgi:hypothetical protein